MSPGRSATTGLATAALTALTLGCDGTGITLPGGGFIGLNSVQVVLTNSTAYPVDPRLFADDDDDTFFDFNIVTDENHVDTGTIPPGTSRPVVLNCDQAGTIKSDFALLILPFETVESDNGPKVTDDGADDFDCGDTIEFQFIDTGVEFFTRVFVNGELIEG